MSNVLLLNAIILKHKILVVNGSTPCPLRIILTLAWLPDETILLDGCDFKHWLVIMEVPPGDAGNSDITRNEIIDSYIKTLTRSSGGCTMAAGTEGVHQGPQPYQILGVSFFLKSETEEMNFSEKFDVELNEPYLVFKQMHFSFTMALD
ncbi:uncharacterized protein C2845_PM07G09210 [Panicum miliaceum]|uniref:Uncharacterized protein n=1 Tax=Panicum miliaceum TaxID=4540 RepID=A0A3L6SGV3_PANMI|nr:uncharacterized protein C2845_PM07G09210 [Panicum miliaceum]